MKTIVLGELSNEIKKYIVQLIKFFVVENDE